MFYPEGTSIPTSSGLVYYASNASGGNIEVGLSYMGNDNVYTYGASGSHSHSVNFPAHAHNVNIPSHTHDVSVNIPSHTHDVSVNIPSHTHPMVYNIYEGGSISDSSIYVDGVSVINGGIPNDSVCDLTSYITTKGFHEISIHASALGRITASLYVKSYIGE